jgi:Putative addiction module component
MVARVTEGRCAVREHQRVADSACEDDRVTTEDLLVQVLQLPRHERARVAEQLLSSLEEAEEQVALSWLPDLERRSREIAEGQVQPVEWEATRAEVLRELEQRRAEV